MSTSRISKDTLITGLLALVALVVTMSAGWSVIDRSLPKQSIESQVEELSKRSILAYSVLEDSADGTVQYSYLGAKMPEKLSERELTAKRTESSWTELIGYEHKGTPEERTILSTNSYTQQSFTEQPDGWYYVEYGQTTKKVLDAYQKENPILGFFLATAHAATATLYAATGDGSVGCTLDGSWAITHASDGTGCQAFSTFGPNVSVSSFELKGTEIWSINKGFIPIDTSSIPLSATITAASLNLYATSTKTNTDNDGLDYVTVVETSQASVSTLAATDYDQCGAVSSPTEGIDTGERKDITSITLDTYLTFTLNSTGRGWIKKNGQSSTCGGTTGYTCLGIREGHDTTNTSSDLGFTNTIVFDGEEAPGTSRDPYLSVTYTVPSAAFWQFQDF